MLFVSVILATTLQSENVFAQGYSPETAVAKMTVAEGLEVRLVAHEPLVRQPVCIEFDDRGRLWVIQYLQYPNPEGLKRVAVDRFSRTKYDRIPEPPPKGPKGADRITILEDRDGDGTVETGKDFVEGLNLASGLAFGHRGVFVLNPPYLLFYPDADRNDVPDSDPEVLLTGFGIEDAHSVANSLIWGPDGWLYGCQGSTVTANIRGIEFQQGVWRYHPVTREFELFCEGGGNSWGLDFNPHGQLFYSTNYGGHVLLHGMQGGYFVKSFAKHGALHNPFAYGYFDHAPHVGFQGGHVTVGGILYQESGLPESYRGKYIAGDLLGHGVHYHDVIPRGSTVSTAHAGSLLQANDTWFAPTDVTTGPDGAIYVADWHDARTAHPDPDAEWDRSNGRIYRISKQGHPVKECPDFATLTVEQLVSLLNSPDQWSARKSRTELTARRATEVVEQLLDKAESAAAQPEALQALWAVLSIDADPGKSAITEERAKRLLSSPHEAVRYWMLRRLGDRRVLSTEMAHWMDDFAEQEPSLMVRQQLACSTARFSAEHALPMINANINRDIDATDPFLPLLWWWAVEKHCVAGREESVAGREEVMKRFVRPTLWKSELGRDVLLPRLIRRYAAEGTDDGFDCVARLLEAAPDDRARDVLWPQIVAGWNENTWTPEEEIHSLVSNHPLRTIVTKSRTAAVENLTLLELAVLFDDSSAIDEAMGIACDRDQSESNRIRCLQILRNHLSVTFAKRVLKQLEVQTDGPSWSQAAIETLGRLDDTEIAGRLILLHQKSTDETLRSVIRQSLLTRRTSARLWLEEVDSHRIEPVVTPIEQVRLIALLKDEALDKLVQKHWGKIDGASREEKLAEVRRLNNDLRAATGDHENGKVLFRKHCGACHKLFGEGTELGPDLTTANRMDRDFLLVSLVDPSSVIRREYVGVVIQTKDGRLLSGLVVTRGENGITIANAKNERTTIGLNEIEELSESAASMMPDNLYLQLKPQELRDLFALLQIAPGR
ncbi:MAG: c-type cytochrome [Planctomyces sp.]|nr:c-type cytochrome [Planctomyces sp.]